MAHMELTPEQQYMIEQVAATMAIENMPLTEQCYENLEALASGGETADEIILRIMGRYADG